MPIKAVITASGVLKPIKSLYWDERLNINFFSNFYQLEVVGRGNKTSRTEKSTKIICDS